MRRIINTKTITTQVFKPETKTEVPKLDPIDEFLVNTDWFGSDMYQENDVGDSQLFADCFKNIIRFVPERKCWYVYEDGIWLPDVGGLKTMEYCKKLANKLLSDVALMNDDPYKIESIQHYTDWQERRHREIVLKDAQSVHPISMKEFDSDPYIFNCKNGTLHLDTMEFTPHKASDKLTKKSDVIYDPEAKCPRFNQFVNEIMSGDESKARYLQKAFGYGISGDTRYECLFMLYGATTRNGKGTLCESVLKVLGSYGCTSKPETISLRPTMNSQNPSEDIARLAGIRFTNISEPGKGMRLNSAQLKSMTGNDTLNARYLHENSFDFKPQFKLYINTNYLPNVDDATVFASNRVIVIPFNRHFEESEQDKSLKEFFSLKNSQSAIFNWLIEGFNALKAEGFEQPEAVKNAIHEYRKDSDTIMNFCDECLVKTTGADEKTAEVYAHYRLWCEQNGGYPESAKAFNQSLRSFATVTRKRPRSGGNETTFLLGYHLV